MTLRMAEEVTILREIVPLPPYNLFRQAVLLSAGLEAGHGPGQSRLGVVILVDALLLTQTFLGPLPGGLGPLAVDLLRVLGKAHQQDHIVRLDLYEARAYGGGLPFAVHLVAQLSRLHWQYLQHWDILLTYSGYRYLFIFL